MGVPISSLPDLDTLLPGDYFLIARAGIRDYKARPSQLSLGGGGGGAVSSVSNSDGTLIVSPTTGSVVSSLNLSHSNIWLVAQTFSASGLILTGSGKNTILASVATSSDKTITFPNNTGTVAIVDLPLSQFASTTSSQLAGIISDETGTGSLTFATSPALAGVPTAPTASSDTNNTQIATTAYVTTAVANVITGVLTFKGSTDCSGNPNYPSALKGDAYVVTVAGKIGGASGTTVGVGDVYFAIADNAGGTQASVGASWNLLPHGLSGSLLIANNLSDLASASTARTNLGVPSGSGTSTGTNTGDQTITLTGNVTGTGTGSFVTTIAAGSVTNAMHSNVSTSTFKGRLTSGSGSPEDLTTTQATSLLNVVVGDSGSGGTKGLVPSPAAGETAKRSFLAASGSFTPVITAKRIVGTEPSNSTTTLANLDSLSQDLVTGESCGGRLDVWCENSVAAGGIKFDFNGGTATMSNFRCGAGVFAANSASFTQTNTISSALNGVIGWSQLTNLVNIVFDLSFDVLAGGTFVPRFATNSSGSVVIHSCSNLQIHRQQTPTATVSPTILSISVLTLSWSIVSGADTYNLYRSVHNAGVYTKIQSGLTSLSTTDTTIRLDTDYDYYLTAVSSAIESSASNIVTLTKISQPVAFYDFASLTADATGRANTLSIGGAAKIGQGATGKWSQGASFYPPTHDYLYSADTVDLRGGNQSFTWAGWVNLRSLAAGDQVILNKGHQSSSKVEYQLTYITSSQVFRWQMWDGNTTDRGHIDSSVVLSSTTGWCHVACGYNTSTGKMFITVNNQVTPDTFTATGAPGTSSSATFTMGVNWNYDSSPNGFFDGCLDEWGKWNLVLSSAELAVLCYRDSHGNSVTYQGGVSSDPGYLFPSFKGNSTDEISRWYQSADGITFTDIGVPVTVHTSSGTYRDPAIIEWNGKWYQAFTTCAFSDGTSFEIQVADQPRGPYRYLCVVDCSSIVTGSGARVWSPIWFIDPTDNTLHITVSLSQNSATSLTIYHVEPTSTDLSTWSAPSLVSGLPSGGANAAWFRKNGSNYEAWFNSVSPTVITIYTSASRFTGYSSLRTQSEFGSGSYEGVQLLPLGGASVRAYVDSGGFGGGGESYADSSNNGSTFGSVNVITSDTSGGYISRNGLLIQTNIPAGVPSAPISISVTPAVNQNSVTWTPVITPIDGYLIYRRTTVNSPYTLLATVIGNNSYIDSAVNATTMYFYKVSAFNINGESLLSPEGFGRVNPLFFDLCVDADNTNITSHTPDVGSAWQLFGSGSTAKITGNRIQFTAAGTGGFYNNATIADYQIFCDITNTKATFFPAIAVRLKISDGSCFFVVPNGNGSTDPGSGAIDLVEFDGVSTFTNRGHWTAPYQNGTCQIKIDCNGSTITIFSNGSSIGSYGSATRNQTETHFGITGQAQADNNTIYFKNFCVLRRTDTYIFSAVGAVPNNYYLQPTFLGNGSPLEVLRMIGSLDGANFVCFPTAFSPSTGTCRDASYYFDGTKHWLGYTSIAFNPGYTFGVASSTDGINWTTVLDVDCSAITGTGSDALAGSPVWYPDVTAPQGVRVFCCLVHGTPYVFKLYEIHPTNSAFTTWSSFTLVSGAGLPTNDVSGIFFQIGGTHYCVFKDETASSMRVMSSSSLITGYSMLYSGDFMGLGTLVEGGGFFQKPNGQWRVYVDQYGAALGISYADQTAGDWTTGGSTTWSALTPISSSFGPHVPRNGITIYRS